VLLTKGRRWRHLDFGGIRTYLVGDVRRAYCKACKAEHTELVPWATEPRARFTEDFDLQAAVLVRRMDKTAVTRTLAISWRSVGRSVERVMRRFDLVDSLEGLEQIGVDEISFRKGHRYLTLVTDMDRGRVVWGAEGKSSGTLGKFFDDLGVERTKKLKTMCSDMSKAFVTAIADRAPGATHVIDRFHLQALVTAALDDVRRVVLGRCSKAFSRGTRWALLKNPESLTDAQEQTLSDIERTNYPLYQAYLIKEQFRAILDRRQPNVVRVRLNEWCQWVRDSKLGSFLPVTKTIEKHMEKIIAYIRTRLTNGLVEGLNCKVRLLIRRAYGFHSAEAVIAMVRLCCSKITLPTTRKAFVP
jgi:transposase